MYSLKEFVWLANRSEGAFWAAVAGIGSSWQVIFTRLVQFRRGLQAYARLAHGNGTADNVQERALCHLNRASLRLWEAFRVSECKPFEVIVDGEKINKCGKHGDKQNCRNEYEGLVRQHIFPK
jgi:hypothetical protein